MAGHVTAKKCNVYECSAVSNTCINSEMISHCADESKSVLQVLTQQSRAGSSNCAQAMIMKCNANVCNVMRCKCKQQAPYNAEGC